MLRPILLAAIVVLTLACLFQDAQAHGQSQRCRKGFLCGLFEGYGPGPFGHGSVGYAGYCPRANYTECGCRIQ